MLYAPHALLHNPHKTLVLTCLLKFRLHVKVMQVNLTLYESRPLKIYDKEIPRAKNYY